MPKSSNTSWTTWFLLPLLLVFLTSCKKADETFQLDDPPSSSLATPVLLVNKQDKAEAVLVTDTKLDTEPPIVAPINVKPEIHCDRTLQEAQTGEVVIVGCRVTDDRLQIDQLTVDWKLMSAPMTPILSGNLTEEIRFIPAAAGEYVFEVLASDGELLARQTVVVNVRPVNQAPEVSCPTAVQKTAGEPLMIECSVADDGLPGTGAMTLRWEDASGQLDLSQKTTAIVTLLIDHAGDYRLRLIADDGLAETSRQVNVHVASPSGIIRILPLGDSITQSDANHRSYRYALWKKLVDANVPFDFIGSERSNSAGDAIWPNYAGRHFDRDHEGHWGWRADEIDGNLGEWLGGYRVAPDIALVHLGTNDVFQSQNIKTTLDDLRRIIAKLRAANPEFKSCWRN